MTAKTDSQINQRQSLESFFPIFEEHLEAKGIQLRIARIKSNVMEVMVRGGLEEAIPEEHFYPNVQTAVDAFMAEKKEKV